MSVTVLLNKPAFSASVLWDSDGGQRYQRLTEWRVGGVATTLFICTVKAVVPSIAQPLLLKTLPCAAGELTRTTRPLKYKRSHKGGGDVGQGGIGIGERKNM